MPGILTYSTAYFNFLPLWSLDSPAHFPLTDHKDKSHHTLHPFTCHNQKGKPLGSCIISWILVSLLFFYVSPNMINFPFLSAVPNPLLLHCTLYCSAPSVQSLQKEVPSHTLYVYKLGNEDNAFLNIVSNISHLRSSKIPSPLRLISSDYTTIYSSHFLASTSPTICFRP